MPKKTTRVQAKPPATTDPPSCSWPPFKPALPVVDLTPALHPSTSMIALIPSFFPRSLCRDYVSYLKTLPLQTTPVRPKRGEAVRVNDRFQIDDADFARRLWEDTGLKEALLTSEDCKHLCGPSVGSWSLLAAHALPCAGMKLAIDWFLDARYPDPDPDDEANAIVLPSEPPMPARTTWTLLLYLTSSAEGCVGGETVFYPNDIKSSATEIAVPLETGMLLLHKHGHDCLLHEGRQVTAGEKWVLRTDLCVKR